MNRPCKQFFPRPRLAQNQYRNVPYGGFLSAANGKTNRFTVSRNLAEARDFLWASCREGRKTKVRRLQELRHEIDGKVKRYLGLPCPPVMRLVEGGWVSTLAEKYPNRRHGRCAGTQVDAKLGLAVLFMFSNLTQNGIGCPEYAWVIRRIRDLDSMYLNLDLQPLGKPFCQERLIVA